MELFLIEWLIYHVSVSCSLQNDNFTVNIQALQTLLFVNEDNYQKLMTQSSGHAKMCEAFFFSLMQS